MAPKTFPVGRVGQAIYAQTRNLLTGQIVVEPQLQVRVEGLDEERVESYTQLLLSGKELPPISVFEIEGKFYVVDGFHRLESHKRAQRDKIACEIKQGTFEEAFDLAADENLKHGLALSSASKKRLMAHYSQPGRKWHTASTRVIAAAMQLSPDTVSRWRAELSEIGQLERPDVVTGKDGVVRNITNIRDAAQNRQQEQLLADSDPAPEPAWKADRVQLTQIEEELSGRLEAAREKWQAAIVAEEEYADDVHAANAARNARIQAELEYKRLDAQARTFRDDANQALAIKQDAEAVKEKRIQDKVAVAVERGWIDAGQAETQRFDELNPSRFDFRLRNLATGEVIDPHTRPADRVLEQKRAMEAAEDAVNGDIHLANKARKHIEAIEYQVSQLREIFGWSELEREERLSLARRVGDMSTALNRLEHLIKRI